jgi:hypothetical protein
LLLTSDVLVVGTLTGSVLMSRYDKNQVWEDWIVFNGFHQASICNISFIPQDRIFLTCGSDGIIKLWDYEECRFITNLIGNTDTPTCTENLEDCLITGTIQGRICRWKLPSVIYPCDDMQIDYSIDVGVWIECMFRNANNSYCLVYVKEQSQPFYIMSHISGEMKLKPLPKYHEKIVTAVKFYPGTSDKDSILLSGDLSGKVAIWVNPFSESAYPFRILENHICSVSCLFYNSSLLVTGGVDGTLFVINAVNFKTLSALNGRYKSIALNERRKVNGIVYQKGILITLQGEILHSWCKKQRKIPITPKQKHKKLSIQHLRSSGGSQRAHFKNEVHMAIDDLEREKLYKKEISHRLELVNGSPKIHGMDEDDLVSYAMMLSLESNEILPVPEPLSEQETLDLAIAMSLSENPG